MASPVRATDDNSDESGEEMQKQVQMEEKKMERNTYTSHMASGSKEIGKISDKQTKKSKNVNKTEAEIKNDIIPDKKMQTENKIQSETRHENETDQSTENGHISETEFKNGNIPDGETQDENKTEIQPQIEKETEAKLQNGNISDKTNQYDKKTDIQSRTENKSELEPKKGNMTEMPDSKNNNSSKKQTIFDQEAFRQKEPRLKPFISYLRMNRHKIRHYEQASTNFVCDNINLFIDVLKVQPEIGIAFLTLLQSEIDNAFANIFYKFLDIFSWIPHPFIKILTHWIVKYPYRVLSSIRVHGFDFVFENLKVELTSNMFLRFFNLQEKEFTFFVEILKSHKFFSLLFVQLQSVVSKEEFKSIHDYDYENISVYSEVPFEKFPDITKPNENGSEVGRMDVIKEVKSTENKSSIEKQYSTQMVSDRCYKTSSTSDMSFLGKTNISPEGSNGFKGNKTDIRGSRIKNESQQKHAASSSGRKSSKEKEYGHNTNRMRDCRNSGSFHTIDGTSRPTNSFQRDEATRNSTDMKYYDVRHDQIKSGNFHSTFRTPTQIEKERRTVRLNILDIIHTFLEKLDDDYISHKMMKHSSVLLSLFLDDSTIHITELNILSSILKILCVKNYNQIIISHIHKRMNNFSFLFNTLHTKKVFTKKEFWIDEDAQPNREHGQSPDEKFRPPEQSFSAEIVTDSDQKNVHSDLTNKLDKLDSEFKEKANLNTCVRSCLKNEHETEARHRLNMDTENSKSRVSIVGDGDQISKEIDTQDGKMHISTVERSTMISKHVSDNGNVLSEEFPTFESIGKMVPRSDNAPSVEFSSNQNIESPKTTGHETKSSEHSTEPSSNMKQHTNSHNKSEKVDNIMELQNIHSETSVNSKNDTKRLNNVISPNLNMNLLDEREELDSKNFVAHKSPSEDILIEEKQKSDSLNEKNHESIEKKTSITDQIDEHAAAIQRTMRDMNIADKSASEYAENVALSESNIIDLQKILKNPIFRSRIKIEFHKNKQRTLEFTNLVEKQLLVLVNSKMSLHLVLKLDLLCFCSRFYKTREILKKQLIYSFFINIYEKTTNTYLLACLTTLISNFSFDYEFIYHVLTTTSLLSTILKISKEQLVSSYETFPLKRAIYPFNTDLALLFLKLRVDMVKIYNGAPSKRQTYNYNKYGPLNQINDRHIQVSSEKSAKIVNLKRQSIFMQNLYCILDDFFVCEDWILVHDGILQKEISLGALGYNKRSILEHQEADFPESMWRQFLENFVNDMPFSDLFSEKGI